MVIDSHVHTHLNGHASGTAVEYAREAAARGVDIVTFTEHMPLPAGMDPDSEYALTIESVSDYVAQVDAARKVEGVKVLMGAEVDWLPEHPRHMEEVLAAIELDVVLGSIHFLGDWAFDDPRLLERYEGISIDALWAEYFGQLEEAAASGLFDVMAHPDLVKKFGFRPEEDPAPLYEQAALTLARAEVAIEVSTAGLRKPCEEIYPAPRFLEELRKADVPATISSDAHSPGEVGWGYSAAVDALRVAGYERVVYFENREPVEVALT